MEENLDEIKIIVQRYIHNRIIGIEKVEGGLVHYVYKIETANQLFFVKIRSDHFAGLVDKKTNPEWIRYEYIALTIFSALEPSIFPKVIRFIPEENMLILNDVMPNRTTLQTQLDKALVSAEQLIHLGKTLAFIHKRLQPITDSIRDNGDEGYYNKLHYFRFGIHNHPVLDTVVTSLEKLPRQLIIGDISPKNINIGYKDMITICDLEDALRGNTISDVGCLTSSIILHNMHHTERAYNLLTSFLEGYTLMNKQRIPLLKKIVLGYALYRLDNKVIPYKLPITIQEKHMKVINIRKFLYNKTMTWRQITEILT